MNIWLVQTGEPLPVDIRTKKMRTAILADKLVGRGHTVTWWASAFDHGKKEWAFKTDSEFKVGEKLKIIALKGLGYKKNVSLSRIIDHRIVARKFKRLSRKEQKPDVIVVSTPPHDLAYEAVVFGKSNGIRVIVDVRDPWPEIFLNYFPAILRRLLKLLIYKEFRMVREVMRQADSLVAPTDTFLKFGLKYADRGRKDLDKIFYLGYQRWSGSDVAMSRDILTLVNELKDKFVIFFVGTISNAYHNPFILLDAAKRLVHSKELHFVISGTGELFGQLKKESKNYKNVTLTGWVDHSEMELLLMKSKVGICPASVAADLPTNKVFAYLSAGLPVISAFQGEMKELMEKYGTGFYYRPNDIDALTAHIDKLYHDKAVYAKMSANAKKVFDEMFDAEKIYGDFADHIEKVAMDVKTLM